LDRTGASLGVSTDGLIKDEEQVQQEIEAERMQMAMAQMGEKAVPGAMNIVRDQLQPGAEANG
ncbi:MAG: hypothetical protein J0I48_22475, partial [Devosia sp.]|nr:hypothetical protein [Devosia sp.]